MIPFLPFRCADSSHGQPDCRPPSLPIKCYQSPGAGACTAARGIRVRVIRRQPGGAECPSPPRTQSELPLLRVVGTGSPCALLRSALLTACLPARLPLVFLFLSVRLIRSELRRQEASMIRPPIHPTNLFSSSSSTLSKSIHATKESTLPLLSSLPPCFLPACGPFVSLF